MSKYLEDGIHVTLLSLGSGKRNMNMCLCYRNAKREKMSEQR